MGIRLGDVLERRVRMLDKVDSIGGGSGGGLRLAKRRIRRGVFFVVGRRRRRHDAIGGRVGPPCLVGLQAHVPSDSRGLPRPGET